MPDDPIVDEIRAIRERQAAKFGFNIRAIVEDARTREGKDGRKVVSLPPRRPVAKK